MPEYTIVERDSLDYLITVDKGIVSRLLRHSDPRMIERYAFYETATLEKDAGLVTRIFKKMDDETGEGR